MKTNKNINKGSEEQISDEMTEKWINPVGGLGDSLILSGVLKQVFDKTGEKFNLARRNKYGSIFKGHPAIDKIGHPPKGSIILRNDYWSLETLGSGNQRPFQILARAFGLETPVKEELYLPGDLEDDKLLNSFIPWKQTNIIIAPSSDSPRKMMHPMAWHFLTDRLVSQGYFVVQVGKMTDMYIKGAYSLLGSTTPRQLISLMKKCQAVITTDSFIMHAAHLTKTSTVALWGPTRSDVYGYPEQTHLIAPLHHCDLKDKCLGPETSENYPTECPLREEHCMNKINVEEIYFALQNLL